MCGGLPSAVIEVTMLGHGKKVGVHCGYVTALIKPAVESYSDSYSDIRCRQQ